MDSGLLIQGNFSPGREPRGLKIAVKISAVLLLLCLPVALVMYGMMVQQEAEMNKMGKKTRLLTETNKELLVQLNRIQSYKNVEVVAVKVPQLQLSQQIVEVQQNMRMKLPRQIRRKRGLPHVSGY